MTILRRISAMLGLAALLTTLSACGGPAGDAAELLTAVTPASPEVEPGGTIDFVAQVAGTVDTDVEWTVLEPGGGTIDPSGAYTAPDGEGDYTILASFRSLATTQSTAVRVKRNARVTVSPSAATIAAGQSLALAASVTGDQKAISWSVAEGDAGGAVTLAGVYTAPQTAGTYHVVATSAADPARSAEAAVTVTAPPAAPPPAPTVAVAVTPQTASIETGASLQLAASVTGSTNVAVTWSVASGGGSVSASGLYTAPATAGTYQVTATSSADPTKRAAAAVTVTAPVIPTTTTTTPTTPVDPSLRTVAQWESLFLGTWESEHLNTYLPLSTSGNSWKYYNLAYGIDGVTAMFEATGNTKYLDRALLYVRNVIASAVPSSSLPNSQFKDGYLGWGAWDHPYDTSLVGGEYPLTESYCFRYVTKLLRAMRNNPAVYADPAYRKTYDDVLAFTKVNIFEKWSKRGSANLYRSRTHMAAHWAFIAADLWTLTADPIERAKYRTVVDNINLHLPNYSSSLRQQMKPASGDTAAYFWSDVWGSTAAPGQDVSHGNNVIAYVVEAHDLGIEWTATDIRALSRTLLNHIWVPTSTGYRYGLYVDGSGAGNGWFNDGFCKLGRYDAAIQKRLETHPVGRGMQLYGNGALNAKILNGR
jgi:hypothetical protein